MKKAAAGTVFALGCCAAAAQTSPAEMDALVTLLQGTTYVVDHRTTREGELSACGLEFSAIAKDHATKRGAPVVVAGSYFLNRMRGDQVAYLLKLGIRDGLHPSAPMSKPNHATVRPKRGTASKPSVLGNAETPGFGLFGGPLDDGTLKLLGGIVDDRKFVVAFNRAPGQQDVSVEIDLTVRDSKMAGARVERVRSDEMVGEFISCTADLTREAFGTPDKK